MAATTTASRRKTPPQKKVEAYKKDRVYQQEWGGRGPNATLQRVTALAQRRYRHAVRQRLARAPIDDPYAEAGVETLRRTHVWNWSPPTRLGEWVAQLQAERAGRNVGWNYFREPYATETHRERFARFLAALTLGRTAHARAIARNFARWLTWDRPAVEATDVNRRRGARQDEPWRQAWLDDFFPDEPAWRERLWTWIRELGADDSGA